MNQFTFENTLQLTESQYLEIWAVLRTNRASRLIRAAAIAAVGVIFLFSPYTRLLGIIVLIFIVFALFAPGLVPGGTRSMFRKHFYLQDPLTCGVSEQKMWVKSYRLDASVGWSMLVVWREKAGWLVLSPSGIPPVYLSIDRLKEEGLYGPVKELARHYGQEYGRTGGHSDIDRRLRAS